MEVEHLTLGGDRVLRDSDVIFPVTIELLKAFQFSAGSQIISFPQTAFLVKVSVDQTGAVFDIMKEGVIAYTNICCFRREDSQILLDLINEMVNEMSVKHFIKPVSSHWIYTIPIPAMALQ